MSLAKKELPKYNVNIINLGLVISLGNCCIGYTGVCLSAVENLLQTHNKLTEN
jgi:hypothetical protein